MAKIRIKIARVDGLPGFGAYMRGSLSSHGKKTVTLGNHEALIFLDVQAHFDDSIIEQEGGGPPTPLTARERKRHLVETLMHEFGHALEEHFGLSVDEDWIDKAVDSYVSIGPTP